MKSTIHRVMARNVPGMVDWFNFKGFKKTWKKKCKEFSFRL